MKSALNIFLAAVLAAGLLAGCSKVPDPGDRGDVKPLVYASFYPMYDLARKAAGEFAEVRCLVPDGIEPHDWEPSPQDIVGLEHADLFFYSGAGFEEWVTPILPKIQNGKLTAIETSGGIEVLGGDPHVWLSPMNAKRQFTAMCEALKSADPAHAADYDRNQSYWSAEFYRLDEEFTTLRELPRDHIVVTHEAFGYLCDAYGLEQISASGYSPEAEPDPASMAAVVTMAKELDVKVVFYEEASALKYAQAIAAETDAGTALLSPLEGLSGGERDAGDDYFSVMRRNLAELKEALS